MKKLAPFLILSIFAIFFLASVTINIYLLRDRLFGSSEKVEKSEVAGISITPTPTVTPTSEKTCLETQKELSLRNIYKTQSSKDFSVIVSDLYAPPAPEILSDTIIDIFDNRNCEKIISLKYDSYKLAGTNTINSVEIKDKVIVVDYHINPNAWLERTYYIAANSSEEYYSIVCNPEKPNECAKTKLSFDIKVSRDQAIEKVKAQTSMKTFISSTKKWGYDTFNESATGDQAFYLVRVYENKSDSNITFNWYKVNKYNGQVIAEY